MMVEAMEESFTGRPREVLDIADAYKMASEATKIVERIEKIRSRGAVSQEDLRRVMTELGRAVETAMSPMKVRQVLRDNGVDVASIEEMALVSIADTLRNTLIDLWMTIRVQ
jgi:cell division FtsZ-interacting protein ZapD